jgi:hypothetical protein
MRVIQSALGDSQNTLHEVSKVYLSHETIQPKGHEVTPVLTIIVTRKVSKHESADGEVSVHHLKLFGVAGSAGIEVVKSEEKVL